MHKLKFKPPSGATSQKPAHVFPLLLMAFLLIGVLSSCKKKQDPKPQPAFIGSWTATKWQEGDHNLMSEYSDTTQVTPYLITWDYFNFRGNATLDMQGDKSLDIESLFEHDGLSTHHFPDTNWTIHTDESSHRIKTGTWEYNEPELITILTEYGNQRVFRYEITWVNDQKMIWNVTSGNNGEIQTITWER